MCRRSSRSQGNGRMGKACESWKIPCNTRRAARLGCVYTLDANVSSFLGLESIAHATVVDEVSVSERVR